MARLKYKYLIIFLWGCLLLSCASDPYKHLLVIQPPEVPVAEQLYKIGEGDIIEIFTWKEPDFTKEVAVRIDGKISFPLLDDIQAAGRTCTEVRDEIQDKLKEYVNYPVVSVSVKLTGSQRFYVIGEVMKPGEYPILKNTTVLQAFALVGGFTEWASKGDIYLIREVDGKKHMVTINYKDIENGEGAEQDIPLVADDVIVVP